PGEPPDLRSPRDTVPGTGRPVLGAPTGRCHRGQGAAASTGSAADPPGFRLAGLLVARSLPGLQRAPDQELPLRPPERAAHRLRSRSLRKHPSAAGSSGAHQAPRKGRPRVGADVGEGPPPPPTGQLRLYLQLALLSGQPGIDTQDSPRAGGGSPWNMNPRSQ